MRQSVIAGAWVLLSASTAMAQSPAGPTCENMQGIWLNPHGPTLNIQKIDPQTGQITGTYSSPSGAGPQQYPLVGWINSKAAAPKGDHVEKVISFAVRWGEIGSITAWTGYCQTVDGRPKVTALWQLSRPNSDFSWDHIITNTDFFSPAAQGQGSQQPAPTKK